MPRFERPGVADAVGAIVARRFFGSHHEESSG